MISRRNRYLLLGFFSVAVFLLLWFSIDYSQVKFISSSVLVEYLVLACIFSVISIILRAIGWYLVLSINNPEAFAFKEVITIFTGSLGAKYVVPGGSFTIQPIVSYYVSNSRELDSETVLARLSVADAFLLAPFFICSLFSALYLVQSELKLIHYVGIVALLVLTVMVVYYRQTLVSTLNRVLPESATFERINSLPYISVPNVKLSDIQRYLRYVTTHASSLVTQRYRLLGILLSLGIVTAVSYSLVFWASAASLGVSISIGTALLLGWGSQVGRAVPLPGGIGGVEVVGTTLILLTTSLSLGTAVLIIVLYRILTFWGIVGIGWLIVTSKELLSYREKPKLS